MARLEIACFNPKSALIAQASGADRIELCSGHEVGGTTPDLKVLRAIRFKITVPIFVMIRPRGGDFVYTEIEFEQMKHSIEQLCAENLADGFVFGILDKKGHVQVKKNSELVRLAAPKPCTFHRAIDGSGDLFRALDNIIDCGFQTILTSGGRQSALKGMEVIKSLLIKSDGRIIIMPGGGVRSNVVDVLKEKIGADWYHSAAIVDDGDTANPDEVYELKKLLAE